ncbi:zinc-binding dehydrogenase, partial [Ensifer sp. Root258]|uniref:zinc-binding dehydrogenase n=1 Tax=Ensifer sp. Root258 TaxID=1736502 RepID=UPI0012E3E202
DCLDQHRWCEADEGGDRAGPIGIMGALVAKRSGARKVVITDINPTRLELARKVGIDHVVDASKQNLTDVMKAIGMTEGFDVGLEMSGAAPAFRDMIDKMNNGGKIAILGIAPAGFEIDWNKVIFKMLNLKGIYGREMFETWYKMIAIFKMLNLKGIYGREMFETWYKMIAFVQGGLDLSPVITHRIGIDEFRDGFEAMRSGNSGKVVMDW